MTSFLIGEVLEPEMIDVRTKNGVRRRLTFAILSGRTTTLFDVWDDNRLFPVVQDYSHGDIVCAVVGDGVDKSGKLRHYLNRIAPCDENIRDELHALFKQRA